MTLVMKFCDRLASSQFPKRNVLQSGKESGWLNVGNHEPLVRDSLQIKSQVVSRVQEALVVCESKGYAIPREDHG